MRGFFFQLKAKFTFLLNFKMTFYCTKLLTSDVNITGQSSCIIRKGPTQPVHQVSPASSWGNWCLGMIYKGTVLSSIQFSTSD